MAGGSKVGLLSRHPVDIILATNVTISQGIVVETLAGAGGEIEGNVTVQGSILVSGSQSGVTLLGNVILSPTGSLSLSNGGVAFVGEGLAQCNLANMGTATIGPGSQVYVTGTYTQAPNATLAMQFSQAQTSGQYLPFIVEGATNLDGSLAVSYVNGFTPQQGESFWVVKGGTTLTGTFSSVTGGTPSYIGTNVFLNATVPTATTTCAVSSHARLSLRRAV